MAIDPVTLEYLRRIGTEPSAAELIELKAIRKGTNDPRDLRLLDAIIRPAEAKIAYERDIEAMERRVAVIDAALGDDGRARRLQLERHEITRMSDALAANYWPMTNREAMARAEKTVRTRHRDEVERLGQERERLTDRIKQRRVLEGLKIGERSNRTES